MFTKVVIGIIFLMSTCKFTTHNPSIEPIIAKVGDKVLYKKEMQQYIPQNTSKEDSINMSNGIIEKWIRKQIWDLEAETNIPSDLNINELVAEYRSNLLRLQYEKKIIEENLDSIIPNNELKDNYEMLKLEYLLKEPILKCWVAKINIKEDNQKQFHEIFNPEEKEKLINYCKTHADFYLLDDKTWITLSDFHSFVPNFIIDVRKAKKDRVVKKVYENYNYYIKFWGFIDKNEIPPLEYIEDNLKKVINQKRKRQLLKNFTEKLYQQYTTENKIKVYHSSELEGR